MVVEERSERGGLTGPQGRPDAGFGRREGRHGTTLARRRRAAPRFLIALTRVGSRDRQLEDFLCGHHTLAARDRRGQAVQHGGLASLRASGDEDVEPAGTEASRNAAACGVMEPSSTRPSRRAARRMNLRMKCAGGVADLHVYRRTAVLTCTYAATAWGSMGTRGCTFCGLPADSVRTPALVGSSSTVAGVPPVTATGSAAASSTPPTPPRAGTPPRATRPGTQR